MSARDNRSTKPTLDAWPRFDAQDRAAIAADIEGMFRDQKRTPTPTEVDAVVGRLVSCGEFYAGAPEKQGPWPLPADIGKKACALRDALEGLPAERKSWLPLLKGQEEWKTFWSVLDKLAVITKNVGAPRVSHERRGFDRCVAQALKDAGLSSSGRRAGRVLATLRGYAFRIEPATPGAKRAAAKRATRLT